MGELEEFRKLLVKATELVDNVLSLSNEIELTLKVFKDRVKVVANDVEWETWTSIDSLNNDIREMYRKLLDLKNEKAKATAEELKKTLVELAYKSTILALEISIILENKKG